MMTMLRRAWIRFWDVRLQVPFSSHIEAPIRRLDVDVRFEMLRKKFDSQMRDDMPYGRRER